MSYTFIATGLSIGFAAGISSGLFGVGGGVIIVPLVVAFFHFSQQGATATSLTALLLPVGAFGVWHYWQTGFLHQENLQLGLLIACGLFFGTFFGAKVAVMLSSQTLARLFAGYLMIMAVRVWFSSR